MDHPLRLASQLRAHLRALRKQRGLTQAQLGQRLGIGQVRVAEIEAQPGLVSTDQLIKLLSALGATLVLRDSGAPSDTAETAPTLRTAARKTARRSNPQPPTPPSVPPKKGSW
jgi:HTH-type transcriptional regulator/antitoxin HipB